MFNQLLSATKASKAVMARLSLIHSYKNDVFPPQFRRDNLIFLPIPGSGGELFLDAYLGFQINPLSVEQCFKSDRLFFGSAFVYAFVRHPIDRFLTAMHLVAAGHGASELSALRRDLTRLGSGVEAVATNLEAASPLLAHPLLRPQHQFLRYREKLYVDRVFKAETWDADLALLREITGIKLRTPDLHRVDAALSTHNDHAEALSPAAKANLQRVYGEDFALFGYT
jgi:hypothetical protein